MKANLLFTLLFFIVNQFVFSQDSCRLNLEVIPDYGEYGYDVKVYSDSAIVSIKKLVIDSSGMITLGKELKACFEVNELATKEIVETLIQFLKDKTGRSRMCFVRREYRIKTDQGRYVLTPDLPESTLTEFEIKLDQLILKLTNSYRTNISYDRCDINGSCSNAIEENEQIQIMWKGLLSAMKSGNVEESQKYFDKEAFVHFIISTENHQQSERLKHIAIILEKRTMKIHLFEYDKELAHLNFEHDSLDSIGIRLKKVNNQWIVVNYLPSK